MPEIIISTLNARYIHASLGARYLYANMAELQSQTEIQEYIINTRPIDIAEQLLASSPKIIGLGVYIWNVQQCTELAALIKSISPDTMIVLGGPEISYETEQQEIYQYADYVITHQADLAFADLCRQLLTNQAPENKIINADSPALDSLNLPYEYFNDEDIRNRIIYVEASRGCPFKCEFCLSSLDKTAWPFDLQTFLQEMEKLYQRGVRQFKFVDRTFNLKVKTSAAILDFFLDKIDDDLFLHFELIPDHLPELLKEKIKLFPAGSLQFEIGIQSFDEATQTIISRKQNNDKTSSNLQWLVEETNAHLHTDLIAGLPGESLQRFAQGFNQLVNLNPHEIQLGILKRLRGTPIIRHTIEHKMRYNQVAPYNILSTDVIDFKDMQRINRFARYWDLIANSGRFKETLPLVLGDKPFENFMQLSDWLFSTSQQTHKIALNRLFSLLHNGMINELNIDEKTVRQQLLKDYDTSGLKGLPDFAKAEISKSEKVNMNTPKRQARHL